MNFSVTLSDSSVWNATLAQAAISNLPAGYFLAQIGEYQQADSGYPAVIVLHDEADTVFEDQWQYYLYAINYGMLKNNVAHLMGDTKAYMNGSGLYDSNEPRENLIMNEDLGEPHPFYDKLRTNALNTHAARDFDNVYYQIACLNGQAYPPMKLNKVRPKSVADIDSGLVTMDDYLYTPKSHPFYFIACNNFNIKADKTTAIQPFDGGIVRDYMPSNDIYSFMPLVTHHTEPVLSKKSLWKKVSAYQIPYRR